MITEKIEVEDRVLASGGFADVRRGKYMGYLVAVKTLRVAETDDFTKIRKVRIRNILSAPREAVPTTLPQQFCKEAILWGTVSHPNVLKLVGVQGDMARGQFVAVSEWMAHGNIIDFIRNNPANRLELVCDSTIPATSFTKHDNSCTGQPRA